MGSDPCAGSTSSSGRIERPGERAPLAEFRETEPFRFHRLSAPVFDVALRQHRAGGKTHCRTLDRLHLAAMEELNVRRLMTNDASQAAAARAMGLEVLTPGAISA